MASAQRARVVAREAGVLAFCLAMAVLATGIRGELGTRFFAGPDAAQDVWVLSWVSGHLHQPLRLYEADNYFPSRHSVLYCDPLLGPAVLVAPLRALTANPILLYNAAVLLSLTLTGYGAYRLARALWGDGRAALLAAALVPYCPPQVSHRTHLNLLTIAGLPFGMLALLRLFERPRLLTALGGGIALGLQASTSGYYAIIGAMLAALLCAFHLRRLADARTTLAVALVALVAGAIVAPHALGFLDLGAETRMARGLGEARHYSLDLPASFLRTQSLLWTRVLGAADGEPMWPGLALLVLAAMGLRGGTREPRVRLLVGVAAFFFVLALGPELTIFGERTIPMPFSLLFHLPLLGAVKHPWSFMVPVFLALGLLAARGLARLSLPPAAVALVVAFAFAETLAPWPEQRVREARAPEAYSLLEAQPPGAVLELPCDVASDTESQWASIFHDRPIVNGRGSFCPDNYNRLYRIIRTEWDSAPTRSLEGTPSWGFFLARFPIRYLVVRPGASGQVVRNIEATPDTFVPLAQTTHERIYKIRNGGRGREIRRWLRADQLRGPLRVAFQGEAGARLTVTIDPHDERRAWVLHERVLTGARETATWLVPREHVAEAMTNVQLAVDRGRLELESLDWDEPIRD